MKTSFPKDKINVLLLENIQQGAVDNFQSENFNVEALSTSLSEAELSEKIQNKHILGIRSKTQVTEKVLEQANCLWGIGAFCIGTNQIDLQACLTKGISVFNAPYSNTRSVVELAIAEIIMLARNITDKSMLLHQGIWRKTAENSFEIRGKKLGILGYGNIGSQLSVLAESLGLQVYYYDIEEKLALGNAYKCNTLKELLTTVDILSIHVDGRIENKNLIGHAELKMLKQGSYLLNLARGFVVDLEALAESLETKHILGAALDVFPEEPQGSIEDFNCRVQQLQNVILTPHIAGSTQEAQSNIASFVSGKLIHYMNHGDSNMSVNFPGLRLPALKDAHRMIHIHKNTPGVLAHLNKLFASYDINVVGQYLKTNDSIGYVITDVSKQYDKKIIDDLLAYEHTVRFRVLY